MTRRQELASLRSQMKKHTRSVVRAKEKLKNGNRKPNKGRSAQRRVRRLPSNQAGKQQTGNSNQVTSQSEGEPGEDSGGQGLGSDTDPSLPGGLGTKQPAANPVGGNRIVYDSSVGAKTNEYMPVPGSYDPETGTTRFYQVKKPGKVTR
jgi:hypothetical protein